MKCEPGKYARKVRDFSHFESIQLIEITPICSETNDIGSLQKCDLTHNFHVNKEGMLEAGIGIP